MNFTVVSLPKESHKATQKDFYRYQNKGKAHKITTTIGYDPATNSMHTLGRIIERHTANCVYITIHFSGAEFYIYTGERSTQKSAWMYISALKKAGILIDFDYQHWSNDFSSFISEHICKAINPGYLVYVTETAF